MTVRVKRIDTALPLPKYETSGSAGFDFIARQTKQIQPGEIELIPGNVIVEVPAQHMLMVVSRSSTPKKKGVQLPHGIGIIDSDYCGPEDEIWIQVRNVTDQAVTIERGEKIAQGIIVPVVQAAWQEVDEMAAPNRGGRGTTGGYHQTIDQDKT